MQEQLVYIDHRMASLQELYSYLRQYVEADYLKTVA